MVVILETSIQGFPLKRGKVRDVYDLGDRLLIVATDRISAFDVVLPTGISGKGKILNQISAFWFLRTKKLLDNHFLSCSAKDMPGAFQKFHGVLSGRTMLVRKTASVPLECVVRGYLSGSGWKEYNKDGRVCGVTLPKGLKESAKLPHPVFTPATKASEGHDINISHAQARKLVGEKIFNELKEKSLLLYKHAAACVRKKGFILADSKFEFGMLNGKVVLIDEIFTPDSSRFWSLKQYKPGTSMVGFDKQYVRDYLEKIKWNKQPPAPLLPASVVRATCKLYLCIFHKITGRKRL